MFKFDLLNIFEGLIRNYSRLNLKNDDDKNTILKKETDYYVSVGEVLGYSSIVNGLNEKNKNVEIFWRDYDDIKGISTELVLYMSIEDDLVKDVQAVENLLYKIKAEKNTSSFIQVIQVSSIERINYLNRIVSSFDIVKNKDILLIYKIQNFSESKTNIYAYLFNGNNIVRTREASSYIDILGFHKTKLKQKNLS
ncbi:hypothetical protein [Clostridium sp.]|uniref:hypothetical protein n=1 Tax=Clostridium sp. TaxID=1506 RepID=UPI003F37E9F2